MDRFERRSTGLAIDESIQSAAAARQAGHFNSDRALGFAPGARFTLGLNLGTDPMNRLSSVNFTFMGLNNWSDQKSLTSLSPNALYTNFDPLFSTVPGFTQADFMQYTYTSHFNSYELNFRVARRLSRDRMVLTRTENGFATWRRRSCRPYSVGCG